MTKKQYDYGMVGLGTMGRNLAYNMCDNGFSVAGFDKNFNQVENFIKDSWQVENFIKDSGQVENFIKDSGNEKIFGTTKLSDFVEALKTPRVIMLLVPAGLAVDKIIDELMPFLSADDLIIDCGNSHFTDTDKRIAQLAKENLHFMGIGISGGEEGARNGASIMPSGVKKVYERIAPMLESICAKVGSKPCVAYLGNGSAGHYVKMVHNGIEYGLMQLIAETYHLLKEGAGLNNDELSRVFSSWNEGILKSFLLEITSVIFAKKDHLTSNHLIDMILDSAHQKGTGKWASQNAMDLQTPLSLIDTAVFARELSALREERQAAQLKLPRNKQKISLDKNELIKNAQLALYFAFITTYSQGMSLLAQAEKEYQYDLNLADIASIWRGGCIIRADLLEQIYQSYQSNSELKNLLVDDFFSKELTKAQSSIRYILQKAIDLEIPLPAFSSSLAYFDSYRCGWLPTNLIQAQRDYFGAHTYERTDRKGIFHTNY